MQPLLITTANTQIQLLKLLAKHIINATIIMNIRDELIKYAKWYDRATMPEDAQTDEADLVQNVESYLQSNKAMMRKKTSLSDVNRRLFYLNAQVEMLDVILHGGGQMIIQKLRRARLETIQSLIKQNCF